MECVLLYHIGASGVEERAVQVTNGNFYAAFAFFLNVLVFMTVDGTLCVAILTENIVAYPELWAALWMEPAV